jgi:hypothetical protein
VVSAGRQEERVLARAAAGIENRAGDQIDRFGDGPLRLADVPGRLAGIGGFESATISQIAHAGSPLSHFNRAVPLLLTNTVYRLEDLWLCCPDWKQHRVLCGNADGASGRSLMWIASGLAT